MKFNKLSLAPKNDGGGNLFLKIEDGQSVTVVLKGEIHTFYTRWVDNKSQLVSAGDEGAKKRFRVNAIVFENGRFISKILEFGTPLYIQFSDINDEYPLEQTKLKITRRGQKLETTYVVLPLLKEPLTEKMLQEIESVPLNILEHRAPTPPDDERNEFGF